jgi:hypothetical protein
VRLGSLYEKNNLKNEAIQGKITHPASELSLKGKNPGFSGDLDRKKYEKVWINGNSGFVRGRIWRVRLDG